MSDDKVFQRILDQALKDYMKADDPEAVRELLDRGAVFDESLNGRGMIYSLVETGGFKTAAMLLERGEDPNKDSIRGIKALHRVFFGGSADKAAETIKLLLDHGADINAVEPGNKHTILHHVMMYSGTAQHKDNLARLLIERGARTDIQDYNGLTPIDIARRIHGGKEYAGPYVRGLIEAAEDAEAAKTLRDNLAALDKKLMPKKK